MSILYLKTLPSSESEKQAFATMAINEVLDGKVDVLEAVSQLTHIIDVCERIKKDVQFASILETEIAKYGKDEKPQALGYIISMTTRRNYDYSGCGDIYLQDLEDKTSLLTAKMKERKKMLESLKQNMFDSVNGGFEIVPPKVSFTTYPVLKPIKEEFRMPESDNMPF